MQQVAESDGRGSVIAAFAFIGFVTFCYIFGKRREEPTRRGRPAQPARTAMQPKAISSVRNIIPEMLYLNWNVALDLDVFVERSSLSCTNPAFRLGLEPLFESLVSNANIYLYCQLPAGVTVAELEKHPAAVSILKLLAPYGQKGLKREHVLFCTTEKAHEAFSRQLVPTLLITEKAHVVPFLYQHLPYVILVTAHSKEKLQLARAENVCVVEDLKLLLA